MEKEVIKKYGGPGGRGRESYPVGKGRRVEGGGKNDVLVEWVRVRGGV